MQVTQEDGGRLNAFAKEPRMEILSKEASHSNGSRLIVVGGSLLVIALMAFTVAISLKACSSLPQIGGLHASAGV